MNLLNIAITLGAIFAGAARAETIHVSVAKATKDLMKSAAVKGAIAEAVSQGASCGKPSQITVKSNEALAMVKAFVFCSSLPNGNREQDGGFSLTIAIKASYYSKTSRPLIERIDFQMAD
jgi:hypothetical protein